MASDPFFDSLIPKVAPRTSAEVGDLTEHDEEVDPDLAQQEGDVDEWFEQAASGRGGGVVDARPPADQLGAAALPIDGDLVRPGRRPLTRHLGRIPSALPDGAHPQAASVAQPRRLRMLAVVALTTAALLAAVVVLAMRPASPGPPSADPKPVPSPTPAAVSTRSTSSASQQAADQAGARRAARALKRRRAAAAERRRHLAAQRRRAAARRRAARSAAATRRRAPARVAPTPTPTAPQRRVSPPPPAPPRRPSVSPVCAEFPPC
jgi:hypothetical protein